ncbi:MAG: hypothetical protein GXW89_15940 [Phycisphaerae bacterium]|nr:hypothetical protein [Phycisphaerae bacterium]
MRLLLLLVLMLACFAMGPENPFCFLIGFVLIGWPVIAMMAGSVRWLLSLTTAPPAGGDRQAERLPSCSDWSHGTAAQSRVCPDDRCGRVNIEQARFCAQCGRRLV